jgi:hypothetical protein
MYAIGGQSLGGHKGRPLVGASRFQKVQFIDSIRLLDFSAEHYWVQGETALILGFVIGPTAASSHGILFLERSQHVGCTQYMATLSAFLDMKLVLNQ